MADLERLGGSSAGDAQAEQQAAGDQAQTS
jgi:hypothetical protein